MAAGGSTRPRVSPFQGKRDEAVQRAGDLHRVPTFEDFVVRHGDLCLPNELLDPDTLTVTGLIDVGRLASIFHEGRVGSPDPGLVLVRRGFCGFGRADRPCCRWLAPGSTSPVGRAGAW